MDTTMSAGDLDMDKLSYEIFSILESKFLFGYDDPKRLLQATPGASPLSPAADARPRPAGKVRILSVDAGGATDGLLAAASLVRLESSLRKLTGDSAARISDFFDVAAGSGAGGVLVALLFTAGGPGGRPPFSAAEAFDFLACNRRAFQPAPKRKGGLAGMFQKRSPARRRDQVLRQVFGAATLRGAVKPVLIPCYDIATGAPFLFSRAGAAESDSYDFPVRYVCAATAGGAEVRSVDGRTAVAAVDGGAAAGNPAAAAITHVLNNRLGFPSVTGVEDLLVVSLGNGEPGAAGATGGERRGKPDVVRIAGEGAADMVDQSVAMAFGDRRATNYVRIQANMCDPSEFQASSNAGDLLALAEELLAQRNVESVLFRGKRLSGKTNAERLEWAAAELVRERDGGRKGLPPPVVLFKEGSPRSSSSSPLSSSSGSPMAAASPR